MSPMKRANLDVPLLPQSPLRNLNLGRTPPAVINGGEAAGSILSVLSAVNTNRTGNVVAAKVVPPASASTFSLMAGPAGGRVRMAAGRTARSAARRRGRAAGRRAAEMLEWSDDDNMPIDMPNLEPRDMVNSSSESEMDDGESDSDSDDGGVTVNAAKRTKTSTAGNNTSTNPRNDNDFSSNRRIYR